MKKFGLITILLIFNLMTFGKGHQIKVKFDNVPDTSLILAHYYMNGIYVNDTIQLNKNGEGVFKGDTLLPQGLYKLFNSGKNNLDFLLGADQEFSISGKDFNLESVKIEGATESKEFLGYMFFLKNLQAQRKSLEDKKKDAPKEEIAEIDKKINALTDDIQGYWKKKSEEFPNTFFAKFLISNYVPVPDITRIPKTIAENDSLMLRYKYYFQRQHFFDYFDVHDERFLYTPLLKPKIETWFNQVLFPAYDSVKPYVINMIESVRPEKKMFQYLASYFLNASINSDLMGMDALFIDLAKKYYLSGESFWTDSATIARIRENVMFTENNLIGKTAPELRLESFDGEYVSLHEIVAPFTLLLIYEPNCSHCQVFVPKLHKEVYLPFHQKGLVVYAIYSMDKRSEWEEFIKKEGLSDWINVWDPRHISRFKITYDARKTPGIYLLDRHKTIIAKKVSIEQIKEILQRELK